MKKKYLNPKALFDPRFFTHTVAVSGEFTLAFVAGQVSYDRDGVVVGKGDIRAQSEQVFKALDHNLKAAGAAWRDVVKMNAYLVRATPEAVNIYREVRARYLDPKALPASTLIGVERLVNDDLLLEVEVIAATPTRSAAKR
jgi:enamine deaminase RidA (YjgF/YER057c/UK114 family)